MLLTVMLVVELKCLMNLLPFFGSWTILQRQVTLQTTRNYSASAPRSARHRMAYLSLEAVRGCSFPELEIHVFYSVEYGKKGTLDGRVLRSPVIFAILTFQDH
jgi:hypothetical protein